jgi:ribosomal protein S18 acetylase RimI-like enzyme
MIELRNMLMDDLSFLLEVRNDETTRYYLENDSVFTLDECKIWFKNLKSPWYIIINENLKKVGYIRTNGDDVGCDIHPLHRRKGYAKLAYQKFLHNKTYASLWVFEDNFAKELYESLGFIWNGEFKIIRDRRYIKMVYEK